MSFDKAIKHGKTRRKPYRGSKQFDATCRNHGTCAHCTRSRTWHNVRREASAEPVRTLPPSLGTSWHA